MTNAYRDSELEKRTNLSNHNQFELLIFRLSRSEDGNDGELYGINVAKVREITMTPSIVPVPGAPAYLLGMSDIRGQVIPVIDLAAAAGFPRRREPVRTMIVTEFSRSTQGFAVEEVDDIVRVNWRHVLAAESCVGGKVITSIARLDGDAEDSRLAQVIDVEQVLRDVLPPTTKDVDGDQIGEPLRFPPGAQILAADDSVLARNLLAQVFEALEVPFTLAKSGMEAWQILQATAARAKAEGKRASDLLPLLVCDLEMPEMDGFTLTRNIKNDPTLASIQVVIHSSLTGKASEQHAHKAGADAYVTKFAADELAQVIRRSAKSVAGH